MVTGAGAERFGCERNTECVAGYGHAGLCDFVSRRYSGLPDPHRHNPFAVAVVLAVLCGLSWLVVAGVVLIMIAKVGE